MADEQKHFKVMIEAVLDQVNKLTSRMFQLEESIPKETPLSNKKIAEDINKAQDYIKQIDANIDGDIKNIHREIWHINERLERIETYMKDERFIHVLEKLDQLEMEFKLKALEIVKGAIENETK